MFRKSLFILLLMPLCILAQSLDVKKIGQEVSNPKSIYYYDRLEYKFRGLPATLDKEEAKHLYYGRLFISDKISVQDSSFLELRKAFETQNFQKCASYGRELWHKDPTNLDILLIMMRGLDNMKEYEKLSMHMTQFRALTDVILASGDGTSEKTAYIVNTIGDEYILLNMLNVSQDYQRSSRPVKSSMLDVWSNGNRAIYIKVLYTNLNL